MNILQFNVRLAEGGAAGVALDLHQRALQQGLASHFVYGYGKGGKESVSHQNYPQVIKHTPRMTEMCIRDSNTFAGKEIMHRAAVQQAQLVAGA